MRFKAGIAGTANNKPGVRHLLVLHDLDGEIILLIFDMEGRLLGDGDYDDWEQAFEGLEKDFSLPKTRLHDFERQLDVGDQEDIRALAAELASL